VDDEYLDDLAESAELVDALHERLLPLDDVAIGPDGQAARMLPYRRRASVGEELAYTVEVRNPLPHRAAVRLAPVLPLGWRSSQPEFLLDLDASEEAAVQFTVTPASAGRRHRLAVDVTFGDLRLGQHAEALVDVTEPVA
jgi:hypothetical protein